MFDKLIKKSLLLKPKTHFIGVDIGSHSIKMGEVKNGIFPQISRVMAIHTPIGVWDSESPVKSSDLAQKLKLCWQRMGSNNRNAVAVVPGKNIITRYVKFPKMTDEEIAASLRWEAGKYVPIADNSDAIVQHMILGEETDHTSNQINVLIVVVPRKWIFFMHEVFKLAELSLAAVEIEPLSLWRSLKNDGKSQVKTSEDDFIALDIGSKGCNFVVFQDKELKFSRYISFGGDYITKSIMNTFDIGFSEAQEMKEKQADLVQSDLKEHISDEKRKLDFSLRDGLEPLTVEVNRSIDFVRSQSNRFSPRMVLLSGGTAKLKGLETFMEEQLRIPVALGLQKFDVPEQFNQYQFGNKKTIDPKFGVALGLSLRGANNAQRD